MNAAHPTGSSVEYHKLGRQGVSLFGRHRIWQGPDHLLLVSEIGCSQEFKRFYFSDIQAFVVMRSKNYVLMAILLPVIALILFGIIASNGDEGSGVGTGLVLFVVWVVHLVRGPTCKCWIQTSINKHRLMMLGRISQARRFWTQIEPYLVVTQGPFSIEAMESEGTLTDRRMRPQPPDLQAATPVSGSQ